MLLLQALVQIAVVLGFWSFSFLHLVLNHAGLVLSAYQNICTITRFEQARINLVKELLVLLLGAAVVNKALR